MLSDKVSYVIHSALIANMLLQKRPIDGEQIFPTKISGSEITRSRDDGSLKFFATFHSNLGKRFSKKSRTLTTLHIRAFIDESNFAMLGMPPGVPVLSLTSYTFPMLQKVVKAMVL